MPSLSLSKLGKTTDKHSEQKRLPIGIVEVPLYAWCEGKALGSTSGWHNSSIPCSCSGSGELVLACVLDGTRAGTYAGQTGGEDYSPSR